MLSMEYTIILKYDYLPDKNNNLFFVCTMAICMPLGRERLISG